MNEFLEAIKSYVAFGPTIFDELESSTDFAVQLKMQTPEYRLAQLNDLIADKLYPEVDNELVYPENKS